MSTDRLQVALAWIPFVVLWADTAFAQAVPDQPHVDTFARIAELRQAGDYRSAHDGVAVQTPVM